MRKVIFDIKRKVMRRLVCDDAVKESVLKSSWSQIEQMDINDTISFKISTKLNRVKLLSV